jgi:integrase
MSITKRQNSKNYFSEFVLNGKRYIKSTRTNNKTLASKIDQKYYQEAVEEQALGGNKILLKDALSQYQKTKRDNIAHNKSIGRIIKWLEDNMSVDIPLVKVDTRYLQTFVEKRFELGLMPGTVRANLLVLSGCINLMKKLGYDTDPKLQVPTVTVKPTKLRVLSKDEEQRLLNELLPRKGRGSGPSKHNRQMELYTLVVMLLDSSCRHNEINELKWSQVDLENRVLNIWRKKTSSAAVLPISNRVFDLLVNKERTCEWLFPNINNDGPKVYNRQPFDSACKRAKIEGITIHSLRHTGITRLAQAGLSTAQIQQISGHSDLKSLQIYQHLQSRDVVDIVRNLLNQE